MPDKKCPSCGLWSTGSALLCDCGYDFEKSETLNSTNDNFEKDEPINSTDGEQTSSLTKGSSRSILKEQLSLFIIGSVVGAFFVFIYFQDLPLASLINCMITGGLVIGGLSLIFGEDLWVWLSRFL